MISEFQAFILTGSDRRVLSENCLQLPEMRWGHVLSHPLNVQGSSDCFRDCQGLKSRVSQPARLRPNSFVVGPKVRLSAVNNELQDSSGPRMLGDS